jgi:hypothetical protein
MASPIKTILNQALMWYYPLENDKEILGHIKAELYPDYVLIHPALYKVTKESYKGIQELFKKVTQDMIDMHYCYLHALTPNRRMVEVVTNNTAYPIAEMDGGVLYECRVG